MKRSLLHHKVIQNRNSSRGYLRNILLLLLIFLFGISTIFPPILYAVESPDANKITEYHLDSPPHPPQPITPSVVSEEEILKSSTAVLLTDVPTSNWTYGCAATAAGMLFGYYDRIGYDNLYSGPANGGICPLTNLGQGTPGQDNGYPNTGSCHIIATEKGHDGITTPAHVDAYWSSYLDPGPDPWKNTPIDVLIQQGFETSFPPVGWTTTGWLDTFYGPSHTGSHHAYSWTAGDSFTLPLCTLNLSSTLTFWYAAEHMNHPMTLEVYLDEILLWKDEAYTHTIYQQAVINLSEYTGLHQLSILGNTSDTYGQLLDDIQLTTSKEPLSGACVADYIGTNQWKWDTGSKSFNVDGSTCYFLWTPPLSLPLYDYIPRSSYGLPPVALSHGLRLFAESRGYQLQWNDTVINHYGSLGAYEVYNQPVDTFVPGGFSFMDYTKEIDQGYPVLIHVEGHTMIGVGYDHVGSSDILYVHDTWDNHIHSMIWGGYYGVGTMRAVTVFHLAPLEEPSIPLLSWYPQIKIPSGPVNMTVVDGNESYFIITLSNVSDGSALGNKDYWGWCFEKAVSMTREQIHPVRLCHSFDPDMPEAFKHANWTLINFIINRDDLYPTEDIQEAIWAILEGNTTVSLGAQTVIADATTQGSSYLPGNGDYLAVLAYLDPESEQGYPYSVQNTFLQVPLTYTACPLPYWRDTLDFWPAPFAPDDLVGVYVDLPSYFDSIERFTLQEILEGSSSSHPLFSIYTHAIQQAIVALLNAHHTDISYPITYDQIIISLHDALPSPAKTVLLTIILNGYNHIGCDCMDSGLTCPCCS